MASLSAMVGIHAVRRACAVAVLACLLCAAPLVLVAAFTESDYTAAQQLHTRMFLEAFKVTIPSLQDAWAGADFCQWPGVTCDEQVAIDFNASTAFEGNGVLPELPEDADGSEVIVGALLMESLGEKLYGTLPASWGRLEQLEHIDLHGNALTGTLPGEWAVALLLDGIVLHGNQLSGPLPAPWVNMRTLIFLHLANNSLTGPLPELVVASPIATLYLDSNNITGSIPASWGNFNDTVRVDVSNNHLCGCLPSAWQESGTAVNITADPAVVAADCATSNSCSTTTTTTPPPGDAATLVRYVAAVLLSVAAVLLL